MLLLRQVAMVILLFFSGLGRADHRFFGRYAKTTSTLFTKEGRKMAMVILLSFLELEGQTPSSLEDMP